MTQNAANALEVVANSPQNTAKNSNYIRDSESQDSNNQKSIEEGCMEICKEVASGSGNQQFSFEIGRANSGQSVSDTVSRKTLQNAANALKVVAYSLQNATKQGKTQQMRLRLSPIHRKTPQKQRKTQQTHSRSSPIHPKTPQNLILHKGFWESG